jgi:hypothetical protein
VNWLGGGDGRRREQRNESDSQYNW